MSWFIPLLIGLLLVYLVMRFTPRSKVDVKDKYVFITGCDSGFGRATAIRLDKMGACVLATCLTQEGEQSLKSVTSNKLKTFQMDVTKSQQIKEVYAEVQREIPYGKGLWGLVNNAGILCLRPIEWTPLDTFKHIADVNLWGMIDVTKTFLPLVKKARGRVVNFSSVCGRISQTTHAAYSVTKFGVQAFSDALRREMHPWGLKVSMLEPGGFKTKLSEPRAIYSGLKQGWDELSEELKNEYLEKGVDLITAFGTSPHTYKVVDAVVDGLTSHTPRDRYLIGWDARLFFIWMARLPTGVADFILMRMSRKIPLPLGSK